MHFLVQDELRKKTAELEAKETEHKKAIETTATEHKAVVAELNKKLEELTKSNSELKEQRETIKKQLNGKSNFTLNQRIIAILFNDCVSRIVLQDSE